MTLPARSPKGRLGWLIALGLLLFAAGIFLGPSVHNYKLSESSPIFAWPGPANKPAQPAQPQAQAGLPTPTAVAVAPATPPAAAPAVAPTVAPLEPSPPPVVETPTSGRGQHGRSGGKSAPAAKQAPVASAAAKKEGKAKDPFDLGDDSSAPTAAARKGKAAADEPAPAKTNTKAAGGGGALDDLMGGVMAETKSKGKKDKDIDALLKDVQKSEPAAAPKREEPAAAEPLSPSDISKGMGVVKTKAKACAQSTGQSGIAELKMTVGKNGKVTDVVVGGKLAGSPLAGCVERAARTAVFRPNTGLTFDYKVDAR